MCEHEERKKIAATQKRRLRASLGHRLVAQKRKEEKQQGLNRRIPSARHGRMGSSHRATNEGWMNASNAMIPTILQNA
jgi:hypothetical protein